MIAGSQFKFEFAIYFSNLIIGKKLTQSYSELTYSKNYNKEIQFIEKKDSWAIKSAPVNSYFLSDCLERFLEESFLYSFDYLDTSDLQNLQKSIFVKLELLRGDTMPALNLNLKIIDFLHTIRCNIDIDMYDLR
jgi:hypothetical protein